VAAAENPAGGGAADGMGLGMGFAMANAMMNQGVMAPGMAAGPAGGVMQPPPPPPPAAPTWHITVNGQTQGPFSLQQMVAGISEGRVSAQTLVWSPGMAGWLPAGQVPHLSAYFMSATPPPPPPPR
jgi:hypothetical protein